MKKLILGLVLVFLISISFVRVYSFNLDEDVLTISQSNPHIIISQNTNMNGGKYLVPKGAILGVDDTDKIVYTYKVYIQDNVDFKYYIENIMINQQHVSNDISDLFEFEISGKVLNQKTNFIDLLTEKEDGYYIEIEVILSMRYPNEEQFLLISGQDLSFEILFGSV